MAFDQATGDRLRAMLGQTVTIDIESDTAEDHVSQNVVARFPGSDGGDAIYVLAHYDSWHLSESAIDNALGVGMLVLFAEALRDTAHEADIYLIATGAEEQGLQGAQAWVDDHQSDVELRGELAITLDIPWSAEGTFFCGTTDARWTEVVIEAADALAMDPYETDGPSPASDHVPFQGRGLDAAWCTRQPDRHYHTGADTLDWLDMDEAFAAWEVNRALVWEAAELDTSLE